MGDSPASLPPLFADGPGQDVDDTPDEDEWKEYYAAIEAELALTAEEVAQKMEAARGSQSAREDLIVEEIQRVRRAQFKAFAGNLEQVALRPFVEEYESAMETMSLQMFGVLRSDDEVSSLRTGVLKSIQAVCGGDAMVSGCVYDAITLLAGVDSEGDRANYDAFRQRSEVVRDAAHKLLGRRLPGGPCGPMDEMMIAYDHRMLKANIPNIQRWYTLFEAYMAIFLGHPYTRCDDDDGSKFIDEETAAKEYKKRWQDGSDASKDMKLPAHGVFGDLQGQAACGVFLELAEEFLLQNPNTVRQFRAYQERAPKVDEYAPKILPTDANKNQPLLMERPRACPSSAQKKRLTGRHLAELDDGEIAARICAYMYSIVNTDLQRWGFGAQTQLTPFTAGNAKKEAKHYVQTVFEMLATTSIFLHTPASIMCFSALCRAAHTKKYYKKTGLLKKTISILDPINDSYELVEGFRNNVIRCASGAAANFHTRLLYQFYEYRKPGRTNVEVFPDPNAYLNKTQVSLLSPRVLNRAWDWGKNNKKKALFGTVRAFGPFFVYFMGPGFFLKLFGKAVNQYAKFESKKIVSDAQNGMGATKFAYRMGSRFINAISGNGVMQPETTATFTLADGKVVWDETVGGVAAMADAGQRALFATSAGRRIAEAGVVYSAGPVLGTLILEQLKKGSLSQQWTERLQRAQARYDHNYYAQEGGWLKAKPPQPCVGETAEDVVLLQMEGMAKESFQADTGVCPDDPTNDPCGLVDRVMNGTVTEDEVTRASALVVMNTLDFEDYVFAAAASEQNADATLSDEVLFLFLGAALKAKRMALEPLANPLDFGVFDRSDLDAQARALETLAPVAMQKALLFPRQAMRRDDLLTPVLPLTVAPVAPDGYETDDVPTPMVPTRPPKFEKLQDDAKRIRTGAAAGETKVSELTARLASVLDIVAPLPKGAR